MEFYFRRSGVNRFIMNMPLPGTSWTPRNALNCTVLFGENRLMRLG